MKACIQKDNYYDIVYHFTLDPNSTDRKGLDPFGMLGFCTVELRHHMCKAEQKNIVVSSSPTDPCPKASNQKIFRDSRQTIHSVAFIYSFHSRSIFFQSVYSHALDSVDILFSWDQTGMFHQWKLCDKSLTYYSEAFQFDNALVHLINSDIPWKFFSEKKKFFLPTHQHKSRKNTGNDNIFLFRLILKIIRQNLTSPLCILYLMKQLDVEVSTPAKDFRYDLQLAKTGS